VNAGKAVNYTNAGSVEFLFTPEHEFYFLEVNARLQVEHAITEAVTGIDLAKWQIRIAAGQELTLKQKDIKQRGHSLECRIYAEDPKNQFLPSAGKVHKIDLPQGVNIRHDVGVRNGGEISTFYDPMIAKLIVSGEDRNESIEKMSWALSNYAALGVETNIEFLKECINHEAFVKGETYTTFIDDHMKHWLSEVSQAPVEAILAATLFEQLSRESSFSSFKVNNPVYGKPAAEEHSPWNIVGKWRLGEGVITAGKKTLDVGKKTLKKILPFDIYSNIEQTGSSRKISSRKTGTASFHQVDLDLYIDDDDIDEFSSAKKKSKQKKPAKKSK